MKKRFLSLVTVLALIITSGFSGGMTAYAQDLFSVGAEDGILAVENAIENDGLQIPDTTEADAVPDGTTGEIVEQITEETAADTGLQEQEDIVSAENAEQATEETTADTVLQEDILGTEIQITEEVSETEAPTVEEVPEDISQNADEIIIDLSTDYALPVGEDTYDISTISENTVSGECGDSANYELNLSTGVLRIYGTGKMADYPLGERVPWNDYAESITSMVVEDGITYIGIRAGRKLPQLKSLSIGNTVTEIGEEAFRECSVLSEITWGTSLVKIGEHAFEKTAITELVLPDTVTEIGKYAFSDIAITELVLPSKVKKIGNIAFTNCPNLKKITVPDNCYIGMGAFNYNNVLQEADIGKNCVLEDGIFCECGALQTIFLGEGSKRGGAQYGSGVFENCTNLQSILLPDSWEICTYDFEGCTKLSEIQFKDSNQNYKNVNGVVYTRDEKEIVYYLESLTAEEYSIPEGVTTVGSGAFRNQGYLDYVEIPDSVTTIKWGAFADSNLRCIVLPDSVTEIEGYSLRIKNIEQKQLVLSPNITEIDFGKAAEHSPFGGSPQIVWGKAGSYTASLFEKSTKTIFKERVEVSFEPAGGTVSKKYKIVLPGEPYYTLPVPERKGYIFEGWYTAASGGSQVTRDTVVSGETSHTLYAHWKFEKPVADLDSLSYKFSNSYSGFGYSAGYHIPLSIFQIIFGNTTLAKMMYLRNGEWGGSCYGMAASSGIFNVSGSGMSIKNFNTGANRVYDLKVSDRNAALSLNLRQYIEAMHISQLTDLVQSDYQGNRNSLTAICRLSANVENGAEPVIIAIFGPQGGHALLGYKLEDINSTTSRLYVYDCNYPATERYITITKNAAGQYVKWYYHLNDMYHWGTDYGNCWISYVPYASYLSAWTTRKGGNTTNLLCVNSSNVSIRNYQGAEVAKIVNGQLITSDSNIYEIMDTTVNTDGISVNRPEMLYLPTDVYTIENKDSNLAEFEVSMANTDLGATVSTTSDVITFAVDDSNNLNAVDVESGKGEAYEIELDSTTGRGYGTVQLTGEGNGSTVSISLVNGQLNLNNCENARLTADGTPVNYVTIEAVAGDGGSISPSGICNYVAGGSQTFTIQADSGYAIKDVEVDNYSVGRVTSYTFTDVEGNHTIKAVFERIHVHDWSDWAVTAEATVLNEGVKIRTCRGCGAQEQSTIPKLTPTVKLTASSITLKVKQSTTKVKVSGLALGDMIKSWKSSNSKIVKVNSKGKITAQKKTGKATVTVTLASGLSSRIAVKVQKNEVACKKIKLNKTSVTLSKGKTFKLKPELEPITCIQKVKYTSSNKKVATVTSGGIIKAKKKGKTTIIVSAGKKKVKCKVTVK